MSLPLTGIMYTIININNFFYFSNMLCSSHYAKIDQAAPDRYPVKTNEMNGRI